MSDPLTIAPTRPDTAQRRDARPAGDTRDAPGVLDTVVAGFEVARADTTGVVEADQVNAYKPMIDALLELEPGSTFARYVSPSTGTVNPQSVWRDIERYRKQGRFTELPATLEEFEKQWRAKRKAEIEAAESVAARGNGVAAFIGGVAGAMTDPVNLYTLPVGGGGKTVAGRIITEGLVNMGVEAAMLPVAQRNREALGRPDLTPGEAAMNIALAGVGGAAIRSGVEIAPAAGRAINDKLIQPAIRKIDPDWDDKQIAKAFEQMVPANLRTPEQDAALFVLRRSAEVEDASPYVRTHEGIDAHVAKIDAALLALEEGRIAAPAELTEAVSPVPPPSAVSRPVAGSGYDPASVKAAIAGPESAGDDFATNRMGSSAAGRYQFIEETFKGLYQRVYRVGAAEAARVWNSNRKFDGGVQEALMDRLLADNAGALQRAGLPADPGNLYLAHFAGVGKAVELLRAPRDAPVSLFFKGKALSQNPTYLLNKDGTPKTVGEAIDIIRAKVGDPAETTPVPIDPRLDEPELRNPSLDAERPVVMLNDQPIGTSTFRASEIEVDAELMQFKSGGAQFGVTDRLRTVEEWDSYQAGFVTVWESLDGRRLIADGHQRHGLATRVGARTGQDIQLNAYVLREADGISAADARRITALRNVAEGSGSKTDAAKVFRDLAPEEVEAVLRRMAKGGEFIKDARGLARLDNEAFGAVINEVLPENYGASIGQLVDDPALHMGMVKILADTQPANRRQAEAIIRQALDAGFVKETQDSLFGTEQLMTGLFAQRAKLLDRALSELKRLKGAFGVAVRNADTLEAGGNKIDVAGSAAEVDANARALALVNALALRKGNAVNDLLTRAAERIAAGEQPAAVLKQFVADVRKLDLDDIARETGDAGGRGTGDGTGRSDGDGADADAFDDGPGLFGRDAGDFGPTPAELDALAAARPRSDHTDLPPDPDPRFDEPDGPGIVAAAESAWHDIRLAGEAQPTSRVTDADIAALPAVPDGYVRMWHGGFEGTEAKASGDGGRWFSSDWRYARDYRNDGGDKALFYVDVPENHPAIDSFNIDEFTNIRRGITANAELPENIAVQMRQVGKAESPAVDPNIAARQVQEAQLGAEAPMRADTDQDGTMGLGLFDAVDQKSLFDLGDGRGERSVADIRAELDADKAAIDTMRSCMT